MAHSLPSLFLRHSFLLFLLIGPLMADVDLINLACLHSSFSSLCQSMLAADPKAVSCTDEPCLAHCGLEHVIEKASSTHDEILELLNNNPPPNAMQALKTCADVYSNVTSYLDQVLELLEAHDYGGADEKMGDVRHKAQLCDQTFSEHLNVMTQYNKDCEDVLVVAHDLVENVV